jgi:hypothetical protein
MSHGILSKIPVDIAVRAPRFLNLLHRAVEWVILV